MTSGRWYLPRHLARGSSSPKSISIWMPNSISLFSNFRTDLAIGNLFEAVRHRLYASIYLTYNPKTELKPVKNKRDGHTSLVFIAARHRRYPCSNAVAGKLDEGWHIPFAAGCEIWHPSAIAAEVGSVIALQEPGQRNSVQIDILPPRSQTVKISKKQFMLKNKSYFKKSTGDEAATQSLGIGVPTHQIQGMVYFNS